jgi:phospholipase/lecithinase/hemolysin
MRVTDVVSRTRPFAANFTNLCHEVLQKIPDVRAKPNYTCWRGRAANATVQSAPLTVRRIARIHRATRSAMGMAVRQLGADGRTVLLRDA